MKIRTLAFNTFGSFLRNKVILLFCSLFACIVLLMLTPLLGYKAMTTAANAQQMQGFVLNEIAGLMSLVSGFGSLLAAWAAADSVAAEMKSGTILAVMARPLHRWQFLAGKYLGVMMLMGMLMSVIVIMLLVFMMMFMFVIVLMFMLVVMIVLFFFFMIMCMEMNRKVGTRNAFFQAFFYLYFVFIKLYLAQFG